VFRGPAAPAVGGAADLQGAARQGSVKNLLELNHGILFCSVISYEKFEFTSC